MQQQTELQSWETNSSKNIQNCGFATISFLACSIGRTIAQSFPRPLARSLIIRPGWMSVNKDTSVFMDKKVTLKWSSF